MKGRWFVLSISAHISKALDFGVVSRDRPSTLLAERMVLDEMERRRERDFRLSKCLYSTVNLLDKSDTTFGGWAEGERDAYYKELFPWKPAEDRYSVSGNPYLRKLLEGFKST